MSQCLSDPPVQLQVVAITGATGGLGGCAVLLALTMGASKVSHIGIASGVES